MFYPFYDSGMCFFPEKMMEAYKAETFTGEGKTLFIYFFGLITKPNTDSKLFLSRFNGFSLFSFN